MTYTDMVQLADYIKAHHKTFNGRSAGSSMTFDTIMRCRDYLKREPAATSCSFPATLEYWDKAGYHTLPTQITLALDGDGLACTERRA